jgi:hypothetical protein
MMIFVPVAHAIETSEEIPEADTDGSSSLAHVGTTVRGVYRNILLRRTPLGSGLMVPCV